MRRATLQWRNYQTNKQAAREEIIEAITGDAMIAATGRL